MTIARPGIPRLEKLPGGGHQLLVDGEPFLMRPAELHNSSLSSSEYMRDVWPALKAQNINTVLGSVSWEQIEPTEGAFVFNELDAAIVGARSHQLRLVILWFGSFKNGFSQYAPGWVKTDCHRFPRAKVLLCESGRPETANIFSLFHEEVVLADAKAFTRLMEHIRKIDGAHGTVIMVQVENEVGVLGDSRDRNEAADKSFCSPVPELLVSKLQEEWENLNSHLRASLTHFKATGYRPGGTWEDVFGIGKQTDELFMAYHYAQFVEQVAAAGKAVYPIPHFTNAWLRKIPDSGEEENAPSTVSGGAEPGEYPSGGPVETVLDIWQLFAPSLDFLSPDIYTTDYIKSCQDFSHRGQPLFIPEQRRDEHGALRIWSALGQFQAIGASPFAIDSAPLEDCPFSAHFGLVGQVSRLILNARIRNEAMFGFFFDRFQPGTPDPSKPHLVQFGAWSLLIERAFVTGHPGSGYGIIIQTQDNLFILVGEGYQVTFRSRDPRATYTGLLSFEEKTMVNEDRGEMRTLRVLNGDETKQGRCAVMPSKEPDYGSSVIPTLVGAATRLATCSVYALFD